MNNVTQTCRPATQPRFDSVMIPAAAPSTPPARAAAVEDGRERWRLAWRQAIRDPRQLLSRLGLTELAARLSSEATTQFPLRVPLGFIARMQYGDRNDPLLRQVLPLDEETRILPGFGLDAVGDAAAKTATGVIRKYHGRALLIATGSCAIHCRYCFRRHFPYARETAGRNGWREAIAAIADDPRIEEVVLSGGDPLSLSTAKLTELTQALRRLRRIKRLRIHTRLPIVLPERVDDALLNWLDELPWPVAMVLHANHANEFDATVDAALASLRDRHIQLLNQSVLLRGVNDSLQALSNLSERGFAAGVLPYYLHQLDRVQGTAHFEVDDARARALHAALAARLSGYLVPRLVREVAGDSGKRPL